MTREKKTEYLHLLGLYVALANDADSLQAFNGPDVFIFSPIAYYSRFERDPCGPQTPEAGYYRRSFHVYDGLDLLAEAAEAEIQTSKSKDPALYNTRYFVYKDICFFTCDRASRPLDEVIEEVPQKAAD